MHKHPRLWLAAIAMVMAIGCSNNPTENVANENQSTSDNFGGLTATDEAPAFADPALTASAEGEVEVSDSFSANPAVDSMQTDPNVGWFHFRAVWGHLVADTSDDTPTDWSGSLTISRGAEIIRRVIRFEPGSDFIQPRTDRKLIEWVSFTYGHNDGIAVDLFAPPARPTLDSSFVVDSLGDTTVVVDTIPAEPVTVTFATGPYSRTFQLSELAALDTVVQLSDSNAVAFNAIRVYRDLCPRGIVGGHWGYDSTGQGVFRGLWISKRGLIGGYIRGHFEVDTLGQKMFYGKWIDMSGRFQGFVKGTWKPNSSASHPHGKFEGRIYDANELPIGQLAGHYQSHPNLERGWFAGRWKLNCELPEDDGGDDGQDGNGGEESFADTNGNETQSDDGF